MAFPGSLFIVRAGIGAAASFSGASYPATTCGSDFN